MDIYDKKGLAIIMALIVIIAGAIIAYWGVSNFLGVDEVSCGFSIINGPSCRTKFGVLMVLVFIIQIFGLSYIRSNYLGYYLKK